MPTTLSKTQGLLRLLAAMACLSCAIVPVYGDADTFELASPKNDDHFAVTQPLFFWNSIPTAQKYEVYLDDAKVGEVPAANIPVMHYGAAQPFAVGPHHWSIKAIPATGNALTSTPLRLPSIPQGIGPLGPSVPLNDMEKTPFSHRRGKLGKQ